MNYRLMGLAALFCVFGIGLALDLKRVPIPGFMGGEMSNSVLYKYLSEEFPRGTWFSSDFVAMAMCAGLLVLAIRLISGPRSKQNSHKGNDEAANE